MTDSTDNVVNLNKFRKAKDRADKGKTASANRAAHGRSKAEKSIDQQERDNQLKSVDDHKLVPPKADPDPDDKEPA